MAHFKYEINFMDYLHEKAQESRNKETQAYLMFIAGAVFFIGGVLESLSLPRTPEWFVFVPYHIEPLAGAILGLSLAISGLSLMVYGMVACLIWNRRRRSYMDELRKISSLEGLKLTRKKQKKVYYDTVRYA